MENFVASAPGRGVWKEPLAPPPGRFAPGPLQAISLRGMGLENHRFGGPTFPSKADGVQVAERGPLSKAPPESLRTFGIHDGAFWDF